LDLPHLCIRASLDSDDVAIGLVRHAFGGAGAGRLLHRVRNEGGYRSVACLADANAALPAVVILGDGFGFGIGDVDHIVLVDIDAARPAELRPLVDIFSILVEDLDPVVVAIADKQAAS